MTAAWLQMAAGLQNPLRCYIPGYGTFSDCLFIFSDGRHTASGTHVRQGVSQLTVPKSLMGATPLPAPMSFWVAVWNPPPPCCPTTRTAQIATLMGSARALATLSRLFPGA